MGDQTGLTPVSFRKKRNICSYDVVAGSVSDQEAKEMYELAAALRSRVEME
jgi:hypothetical protein